MIAIIVARSLNRVIGKDGDMPWGRTLTGDLKRFKALTLDHTVIMGRKTFESIGRPLPDRMNIVLSRDPDFTATGCTVESSLAAAIVQADAWVGSAFIIGGGAVYADALALADTIYETVVEAEIEGDTFFPQLDPAVWETVDDMTGPVSESIPTRYLTHWRRS